MTDLPSLIAEAMTEARGKYRIVPGTFQSRTRLILRQRGPYEPVFEGINEAACEAHLERLVAVAVLRKLQAAGLAICDQSNLELCEADYIPVTLAMIAAGDAP